MNVAIIGYGYWGPNLVRNFNNVDDCNVIMVSDLRSERLEIVKKNYPAIITTTNTEDVFNNNDVGAVVIATPVFTHYELAKIALTKGKNVLLEKPMTSTSAEGEELVEIAAKNNKLLMVDHTFLYTGAVRKMQELVMGDGIGKIQYFDSTRINLGLFQPDINVIWDLAPHDISILNFLVDERPVSITATGTSHTDNGIENIAYLSLNYDSGLIAHFNCSWTSPVKIRRILIGGDQKMILFDDVEPTEKVKIYDSGYKVVDSDEDKRQLLVQYRSGDIYVPEIDRVEALHRMASDFINSIKNNSEPTANWQLGLDVVRVLEASQVSIKDKGREVKL
ncbi:Gfo/Idh/MocA family oxidoreductase [Bacteroidales bacterium AH-315-N07]|nr:Gfo/Idh/MocA family oxidoreductase [Bacteroidales bacterium AH-315-N07]